MTLGQALKAADYYGGDQCFGDERDEMSAAMWRLAEQLRALGARFEREMTEGEL